MYVYSSQLVLQSVSPCNCPFVIDITFPECTQIQYVIKFIKSECTAVFIHRGQHCTHRVYSAREQKFFDIPVHH